MRVFIYLMGSPYCKDLKKYMWEGYFRSTWNGGVFGAWMTFKKAEMAKTFKNGLSMIETNPLNHSWSDFPILSGLTLHQFQKKLLLSTDSLTMHERMFLFQNATLYTILQFQTRVLTFNEFYFLFAISRQLMARPLCSAFGCPTPTWQKKLSSYVA